MKRKPVCQTVRPWLKANLGNHCLAPLTGTDAAALDAAVHLVELFSLNPNRATAIAFGATVLQMQEATRELAYHAIAHVMDWRDRSRLWELAGMEPIEFLRRCSGEMLFAAAANRN